MRKGKQQAHGSDRSDSDVSNILFDLFHESCVPQWKEVIGSGSFGVSCKGLFKDTQGVVHDVAMKFLNHLSEEESIEVVRKEMDAFVRLKVGHQNIVRCIGGNIGGEQDWPWEGKLAQVREGTTLELNAMHWSMKCSIMPFPCAESVISFNSSHLTQEILRKCHLQDIILSTISI